MSHLTTDELMAGADAIREAPRGAGTVELIVRRPAEGEREVLAEGRLDVAVGLVGDTWKDRPSSRTPDRSPHPDMQLNIMNARAAALFAGPDKAAWPIAGDQFYVDLDISGEALPPGTRLQFGTAVIEVTDQPHRGCPKFSARFGADALRFVNSEVGVALNARGINARVVTAGTVRVGDAVTVLAR
jgi:hypothetical protein